MKFKDREMKNNELIDEMRYNPNTTGLHESIQEGQENDEKKNCGIIAIFSLMTMYHYYEKAETEVEDKTPRNIIERMFINSSVITNESISSDEMGMLR